VVSGNEAACHTQFPGLGVEGFELLQNPSFCITNEEPMAM
jgi:hypothetical protein